MKVFKDWLSFPLLGGGWQKKERRNSYAMCAIPYHVRVLLFWGSASWARGADVYWPVVSAAAVRLLPEFLSVADWDVDGCF